MIPMRMARLYFTKHFSELYRHVRTVTKLNAIEHRGVHKSPVHSSKPTVTQMIPVRLSGSQQSQTVMTTANYQEGRGDLEGVMGHNKGGRI